jgi:hypothetical protein
MDIVNIVIDVLIEMWWLIALIVVALAYAARVDNRYNKATASYIDEMHTSIHKCQYDRDTF